MSLLNWRNLSLLVANLTGTTLYYSCAAAADVDDCACTLGNSFRSMHMPTLMSRGSVAPASEVSVPEALVASK